MRRRMLAAIAALALATQATGAVAAFTIEEPVCSCPMRGKGHHCDCTDCAEHRSEHAGHCVLGGCGCGPGSYALAELERPFLLPDDPPAPHSVPAAVPSRFIPAFLPDPDREVPTPPPLA